VYRLVVFPCLLLVHVKLVVLETVFHEAIGRKHLVSCGTETNPPDVPLECFILL